MARKAICKKVYVNSDGSESRSASVDAARLEFRFFGDDGETVTDTISLIASDMPENVGVCAKWHGLAQKIGDSYAGASKSDESAYDRAMAMVESLAGGEWVAEGESAGPRTTYLLDAICNVIADATGSAPDDAKRAEIAEAIKTADAKKSALGNAAIKAAYEKIKADAAVARAKAAAKAAKEGGGDNEFLANIMGS